MKRKDIFVLFVALVPMLTFYLIALLVDTRFAETLVSKLLTVGVAACGVILGQLFDRVWRARTNQKPKPITPSLKSISNFADFFGLGLRKKIKAMAGDFDIEIQRLRKEKRFKTAKWNKALAWGYAVWYVLRGPFDWIVETFIKSKKGL